MYEIIQIQLNFVFQISHLASFSKIFNNKHFSNMKHLICYLCRMMNYHIIYDRINEKNANLVEYSDLNFDVCKMTKQSTNKYIFMLNRDSVS